MLVALLAIAALLASGVLVYVMTFGWRRRRRLAAFARQKSGTYTLDGPSELRARWRASAIGSDEGLIGVVASVDQANHRATIFDVHPDPGGPPRRTCCALPLPGGTTTGMDDRDDMRRRLRDRIESKGWGLEVDVVDDHVLVASRGRALHDETEWQQLLDGAEALLSDSPPPRDSRSP